MRVFMTGASGFIGSAIAERLLRAGHNVTALARSESSASLVTSYGAKVHRGDLTDLESLRSGVAEADGVIHVGFNHDFSKADDNARTDTRAIEAMGTALLGSGRSLIVTSGIGVLPLGQVTKETDVPAIPNANLRAYSEEAVQKLRAAGGNVSIIRLPPSVHGRGDKFYVASLIQIAAKTGVSAYIGEGQNRWSAVQREDAADLFCLALQSSTQSGTYHGMAEEGVPLRQIAEAIAEEMKIPAVSITGVDAVKHFGRFAPFASMDVPSSSELTRKILGWKPVGLGIVEDIHSDSYFPLPKT